MYFLLSKILLIFILPLTWVFAVLLFGVFTNNPNKKQRVFFMAILILYLFSNQLMADAFGRLWDIDPYQPDNRTFSSLILLGGFVSEDKHGKGYFNQAADRYTAATKLLAKGKASHLLFTGGNADLNPDGFSEATFVYDELKSRGFADSLLLMEGRARNTAENAANSKIILQKANLKPPYLLVTSAFHMCRALLIFKKAGIPVVAYPCNNIVADRDVILSDFFPGSESLSKWNIYLKEVVGYVVAYIK